MTSVLTSGVVTNISVSGVLVNMSTVTIADADVCIVDGKLPPGEYRKRLSIDQEGIYICFLVFFRQNIQFWDRNIRIEKVITDNSWFKDEEISITIIISEFDIDSKGANCSQLIIDKSQLKENSI